MIAGHLHRPISRRLYIYATPTVCRFHGNARICYILTSLASPNTPQYNHTTLETVKIVLPVLVIRITVQSWEGETLGMFSQFTSGMQPEGMVAVLKLSHQNRHLLLSRNGLALRIIAKLACFFT